MMLNMSFTPSAGKHAHTHTRTHARTIHKLSCPASETRLTSSLEPARAASNVDVVADTLYGPNS